MNKILAVILIISFGNLGLAQESTTDPFEKRLDDSALLERLQLGGLIIVFRHGATESNPDRPVSTRVGSSELYPGSAKERQAAYFDCERQRVLSDKGREDLRKIAAAIRKIGFLVGDVFASPMCRTRESAWLLFGQVKPAEALMGPESAERIRLFTTMPIDKTNRILVSHSQVISGILSTPEHPVDRGFVGVSHCLVFEPDGNGETSLLTMLSPGDWTRLAQLAH